jgi:hypothetical protein
MRGLNTKALAIGIAAIAAAGASGGSGCTSKKPTEIVPGALTQIQVPKDLAGIQVEVSLEGNDKFCQGYQVANGAVELPSTLGVVSGASGETLRITLRGYDVSNSQDMNNCNHLQVDDQSANSQNGPAPRVLRQSIVSYVDQQTLFLPMPLSFACYDVDCSGGTGNQTCKGGSCVDGTVPPGTLSAFDPALVDGTQDCFDPTKCMSASASTQAVVVDPAHCIYTLPAAATQNGATPSYNVQITYDTQTWQKDPATGVYGVVAGTPIETEILSVDPDEGYTIPDANNPEQFQLAGGSASPVTGLCALVQAATTPSKAAPASGTLSFNSITDVNVAAGCPSKSPLLPFCAAQQHNNVSNGTAPAVACNVPIEVKPTPSALYVVSDDSGSMGSAFSSTGYATTMALSFAFPVFDRTYVAFSFLDNKPAECPSSSPSSTKYESPTVPFGLANSVQGQVAGLLKNWTTPDTPGAANGLYLTAAMQPGKGAYEAVSNVAKLVAGGDGGAQAALNVGGVVFFVNRIPVAPGSDGGAGDGGGDAGADGGVVDSGTPPGYPSSGTECTVSTDVASTMVTQINAAFTGTPSMQTFFVVFNDDVGDGSNVVAFYNSVASLAHAGAVNVIDATAPNPAQVVGSFAQALAPVASCLYDLPAGIDTTAVMTFTAPAGTPDGINPGSQPKVFPVGFNSNCNAANQNASSADGWNIDNGRIRVCAGSCGNIQTTILAVASEAFAGTGDAGADAGIPLVDGGLPPVPSIPVDMTMPCQTSGGQ